MGHPKWQRQLLCGKESTAVAATGAQTNGETDRQTASSCKAPTVGCLITCS